MSKEEFLKIQTCVLKVNIHCDGCKRKVKKILQKIDGVYTIKIDSELCKVTVSGNVDPPTLIKKLAKNGKHAELWGKPNPNQNPNQNQFLNQFKNMQIDNGKGGNGNNPQKGGQNGQKGMVVNNPPKGGQNGQIPNPQQQQMLQQLKAFQDMKLPQLKDMKMPMGPPSKDQNQKNVKFNLPEEDDLSDGEFDDESDYDDEDDYDDESDYDDEMDDLPPNQPVNKTKPLMGNGQMPNMMMNPQMMGKIANAGGGGGGQNGKKGGPGGGGGNIQIPISDGKNGKKGGGGGGGGGGNGNIGQIQGGGKNGKGGGGEGKMGNSGGGGQGKGNGGGQNGNLIMNGGMGGGVPGMANKGNPGQFGNMPMGQMGPLGQMGGRMPMGQVPAVQGLPAAAMGGGGGGGYFAGAGPEAAAGNPYQNQQLAAMMMNQQRANGNEQFQPMMYARPPPAVNYMPQYPYPYPYPYAYPPPGEPYAHAFSDENTSSCNVM